MIILKFIWLYHDCEIKKELEKRETLFKLKMYYSLAFEFRF